MHLPPYKMFPTIKGENITLREILHTDINDILEISFYNAIQATSLQEAADMNEKIMNDYLSGNSIHWGIVINESNKIIGTCGYYRGFDKGTGELGCVLLPMYCGKGYMTKAMQMAIKFGINTIRLKRITATTTRENIKAIKLLERLNFVQTTGSTDESEVVFVLTQASSME